MKSGFGLIVFGLVLSTLAACTSVPAVGDIPSSIVNASTSADHLKIADYFARKASEYDAEAAWHSRMATLYAGRPKTDLPAMIAHCKSLKEQFENAAKETRLLELAHRQLARD